MKPAQDGVKVSIFGREFVIACAEDEREQLEKAARYLDSKMKEIQRTGKVIGIERCAIMAALNISHELLIQRSESQMETAFENRVKSIQQRIDAALQEQNQLSI